MNQLSVYESNLKMKNYKDCKHDSRVHQKCNGGKLGFHQLR